MDATPPSPLPESLRLELEALQDQVREDQPRMVQYKQYERRCRNCLEALQAAESQALRLNIAVSASLRAEAQRALEAWEGLGFRAEIDGILVRIRQLSGELD